MFDHNEATAVEEAVKGGKNITMDDKVLNKPSDSM